ncbi:MAG: Hsp20 family protein [Rhizomicrobium sp.]
MRDTIDITNFGRSAIGFERMLDLLRSNPGDPGESYPPYNIEKAGEDRYRIVVAVAGFADSELSVTQEQNRLTVTGRKDEAPKRGTFLHQGIAGQPFTRQFGLADYVQVREAKLANGLLTIELERQLPEAMKPRRIAIGGETNASAAKRAA